MRQSRYFIRYVFLVLLLMNIAHFSLIGVVGAQAETQPTVNECVCQKISQMAEQFGIKVSPQQVAGLLQGVGERIAKGDFKGAVQFVEEQGIPAEVIQKLLGGARQAGINLGLPDQALTALNQALEEAQEAKQLLIVDEPTEDGGLLHLDFTTGEFSIQDADGESVFEGGLSLDDNDKLTIIGVDSDGNSYEIHENGSGVVISEEGDTFLINSDGEALFVLLEDDGSITFLDENDSAFYLYEAEDGSIVIEGEDGDYALLDEDGNYQYYNADDEQLGAGNVDEFFTHDDEDGGSEDGSSEDGGSEDGGSEDGGSEDGGSEDGGSEDGGSEEGSEG